MSPVKTTLAIKKDVSIIYGTLHAAVVKTALFHDKTSTHYLLAH